MSDNNEQPSILFSRSGVTNPFGKCTEELKIPLDEETKEAVVYLAYASGMKPAEFGRYLLQCHCFGHATMMRHRALGGMPTKGHD